jgi:hypothetical protein
METRRRRRVRRWDLSMDLGHDAACLSAKCQTQPMQAARARTRNEAQESKLVDAPSTLDTVSGFGSSSLYYFFRQVLSVAARA